MAEKQINVKDTTEEVAKNDEGKGSIKSTDSRASRTGTADINADMGDLGVEHVTKIAQQLEKFDYYELIQALEILKRKKDETDCPNPLELPVVAAYREEFAFDHDNEFIYRMNESPRGYCLIIHMKGITKKYPNGDREPANTKDVESLKSVFRDTLGFAVEAYADLTTDGINQLMDNVKKAYKEWGTLESGANEQKWSPCCFVMCVLSHGDKIPASDDDTNVQFATSEVVDDEHFIGYKVSTLKQKILEIPELKGIPKLLFVQSCRGRTIINGYKAVDNQYNTESNLPSPSDFLISFATIHDYVAYRDDDGSNFIQCLCDVFTVCHKEYDVVTMMTIVTKRVADINNKVTGEDKERNEKKYFKDAKQVAEFRSTFRKLFYFGKPSEYGEYLCKENKKIEEKIKEVRKERQELINEIIKKQEKEKKKKQEEEEKKREQEEEEKKRKQEEEEKEGQKEN